VSSLGLPMSSAPRERIVDAVLGVSRTPCPRRWLIPLALASTVHLGLALLALRQEPGALWALTTAQHVRSLLAAQAARPIELPPVPPPRQERKPEIEPARPRRAAVARATTPQRAAPPAQAGNVIARSPTTGEPVDLSDAFVVGSGNVYAGGSTTSSGTSTKAVNGPVSTELEPSTRPTRNLSRSVALADPDWTCPWPREADDSQIDEQVAIVRVTISPEGKCESVSVVQDPGFGFGAQGARCAKEAEFVPAFDRSGQPIRAVSVIRVRFTR
jgi:periplasmic protein TonB